MVMGELTTKTDVAVIGGGPGGYTAAIRAAQLGLDVILIEKNELGGACTNVGCIPTKALIHAGETMRSIAMASAMGIRAAPVMDFKKTQEWKGEVVRGVRDGVAALCKMNGVEVVKGRAFFTSSGTLSVETSAGLRSIEFKKAVIATGSLIRGLERIPFDHQRVIDSDDALGLSDVPESLLIIGGGYIAVEMACMFMNLGSKVTIAYRGERLLRSMDEEISKLLSQSVEERGGRILFGSGLESVQGDFAIIRTPGGQIKEKFARILVAVGRECDFSGLGLEKTAVSLGADGRIAVNKTMKTDDERIYAIGDAVPGPQLAHKAFREGKVAAEAIAGEKSAFDSLAMPMVVFSDPRIASAGLGEDEARNAGYDVIIGRMPFSASGKARILGQARGFVKIVAERGGPLLGVQIIGPGAEDLIAEAALALEMGAVPEDLAATIHAHPTLPEALAEAAEDALGKVVHLYRKKG